MSEEKNKQEINEVTDEQAQDIVGAGLSPQSRQQLINMHGGVASYGDDGRYASWIICKDGFKIPLTR